MTTDGVAALQRLPVICIHEDRAAYLVGVKLAVQSLARHAPRFRVVVNAPGSDAEFARWISAQAGSELATFETTRGAGWNVKPSVLLQMLDRHGDVVWIDSDVIVTGDIESRLCGLAPDVLVATEETYWGQRQGSEFRTSAWGLRPGRTLNCTVNTGVLRVTASHVPLLQAWKSMLSHPVYLKAQLLPWYERPVHMIGDQEALTGLLGSSEFARVPIALLRRGTDIAQCFGPAGFTPMERIRSLAHGDPLFIHAMGPKPWLRASRPVPMLSTTRSVKVLRDWYTYASLEVSPYSIEARSYVAANSADFEWTRPRSRLGKGLSALGGRRPAGPGLPLAVIDHFGRWLRRRMRIGRYAESSEFILSERPF